MIKRPQIVNLTLEDLGGDAECVENYIQQLEQERDQLAARVERLEELAGRLFRIKHRDGSFTVLTVDINHLHDALNESPTTSLELRDKQRDRELLLRLAKLAEIECDDWRVSDWIEQKAEEL